MFIFRPSLLSQRTVSALSCPSFRRAHPYSQAPNATKVKFSMHSPTTAFAHNQEVDMVGIPGSVGDFVIAPNSSPAFTELRPGVIRITSGDKDTKYFISGGFAIAFEDSTLNISVGECINLEHIDVDAAKRIVEASNAQLNSQQLDEESRALAQIGLDTATAMIKAYEAR